jgi:hypothetical protein
MPKVTTFRLPDDVDQALGAYCAAAGATRNRVAVLALRSWLGDGSPPAAPVQPPEAVDPEAAREAELVRAMSRELDAREVDPS